MYDQRGFPNKHGRILKHLAFPRVNKLNEISRFLFPSGDFFYFIESAILKYDLNYGIFDFMILSPFSIDFEGGDQVGKGDAVKNFSSHLSSLGLPVLVVSFPYYSTPLGFLIRQILLNGFNPSIHINSERLLNLKMALFALNRLEILNCILSLKQQYIFLFDRGPFSNALTISYHLFSQGNNFERCEEYVNTAISLDSYFIKTLNINNCVIRLKYSEIQWEKSRKGDISDLYERREVQDISEYVYGIFEKNVGNGWRNIITKDTKGWKDREDIRDECMDFAQARGIRGTFDRGNIKRIKYLGVGDIQRYLYLGCDIPNRLKREWRNAIGTNNKKKVYLLAESISQAFVGTTEPASWCNDEIALEVGYFFKEYPEISDIIKNRYGSLFLSNFLKLVHV